MTQHPQNQTKSVGQRAEFCVTASGSQPLSYQWRKNGTPIGGANNPCFAIDPVGTCDAGNYDCVVTNSCGSATSNQATLTISSSVIQSAAAAKATADGTAVTLVGPVVTRVFGSFFYVEDANRASGIRVNLCSGAAAPGEGNTPMILGVLDTILGERVIRDALLTPYGSSTIPKPVGMNNASANRRLPVGLFVTVWGKATVPPGATNRFTLNDGSRSGIEIVLYGVPLPENGLFLKVRGALGWEGTKPVIHVNSQSDLW
ncbi:MAG: immunoglobulin domain-containing protein [Armatimonadetes bacterium]|nr:immunoglobulin domain-containing protein [Armatimonadota bacterium]